jgi:hypothetical protein
MDAERLERLRDWAADRITPSAEQTIELLDHIDTLAAENARLREGLRDAVSTVGGSRKGSIGAMNNVYLAQVDVRTVERWRRLLGDTP